jgi:hypothetical protein
MKTQKIEIPVGESGKIAGFFTAPESTVKDDHDSLLVVMMHDLPFGNQAAHDGLFDHFRRVFDAHGLQSFSFDFRGCGVSSGKPEDLTMEQAAADLSTVTGWAEKKGFHKFIFVSLGASAPICLDHADKRTAAMMLFWPVLDLSEHARRLSGRMEGGRLLEEWTAFSPEMLQGKVRYPILLQYGGKDETVDPSSLDLIKAHVKAPRIDITAYAEGTAGLPDPKHREMMAVHMWNFLEKYV